MLGILSFINDKQIPNTDVGVYVGCRGKRLSCLEGILTDQQASGCGGAGLIRSASFIRAAPTAHQGVIDGEAAGTEIRIRYYVKTIAGRTFIDQMAGWREVDGATFTTFDEQPLGSVGGILLERIVNCLTLVDVGTRMGAPHDL